jgi:hypothetical protein
VYGFAKSDLDNMEDKLLRKFKNTAKDLFSFTDKQIDELAKIGDIEEVPI